MSYRAVGHVIFSLHLGVGHSVLFQLEGLGHVFSNHHISKCSGVLGPYCHELLLSYVLYDILRLPN